MSARSEGGFNPKVMIGVIAVGIVAFIALWVLIALGPQLSSGNDGGGHALSKAAPGYAGVVDLLERAGAGVEIRRHAEDPTNEEYQPLLILTPTHRTQPAEMNELMNAQDRPVLIILPKWQAANIPGQGAKAGWVSAGFRDTPEASLVPSDYFGDVQIKASQAKAGTVEAEVGGHPLAVQLPANAQTMTGYAFDTLIAGPDGGAVLARAKKGHALYVLAEPDLVNNLAFSSRDRARGAVMLIDVIAEDAGANAIAFDVTLNGFGSQRSLLRFAFVPPFIGITLCLIAAGLLALWQAWVRFGPALKPQRAIALSKAALIANSADLIRQARRELDGADAYVHSQRAAIARRLHAPSGLDAAQTDAWIDRRLKAGELFSAIARRLPLARNKHEFLSDAQALSDIRKELLRDG